MTPVPANLDVAGVEFLAVGRDRVSQSCKLPRPTRSRRERFPDAPLPNAPDGRSRGNFGAIRAANAAEGLEITSRSAHADLDGDPVDWQLAMPELIQRE